MTRDELTQALLAGGPAMLAMAIADLRDWINQGDPEGVATVDRSYWVDRLRERHEATAGLPQASDEAADWCHAKPQAPADGGEPGFAKCADCGGQAIYCRCAVDQQRNNLNEQVAALTAEKAELEAFMKRDSDDRDERMVEVLLERNNAVNALADAHSRIGGRGEHGSAEANAACIVDWIHDAKEGLRERDEEIAHLTAERDGLGRQLMAEIEAKLFNINEVVKWTGLATEHRKELHATRAELRKRDAVVEAAKALRLAQNNWALEEALYTALDALEALTQPAASDVLLVPAKDPARNPALIDSFWRDPGGTED